jgi:hypothetical protein
VKKLLISAIVLIAASGLSFAQIGEGFSIGMWGAVSFSPLSMAIVQDPAEGRNKDNDLTANLGPWWGSPGSPGRGSPGSVALGISFHGNAKVAGFDLDVDAENMNLGPEMAPPSVFIGNNARLWARPFNWLRVDFGKMVDQSLMGKLGNDGDTAWATWSGLNGEAVFDRFKSSIGVLLSISPVEGLLIHAGLPEVAGTPPWSNALADSSVLGVTGNDGSSLYRHAAANIYRQAYFAAGYKMEGIGHLRVQVRGGTNFNREDDYLINQRNSNVKYYGKEDRPNNITWDNGLANSTLGTFEAAFALEGFFKQHTFELGVKVPLPHTFAKDYVTMDDAAGKTIRDGYIGPDAYSAPIRIGLVGWDGFGPFTLKWTLIGDIGEKVGDDNYKVAPKINIHLMPSYNLGNGLRVGMNLGMELIGTDTYKDKEVTWEGSNDGNGVFNAGAGLWLRKNLGSFGNITAELAYTYLDPMGVDKNVVIGYLRFPISLQVWF